MIKKDLKTKSNYNIYKKMTMTVRTMSNWKHPMDRFDDVSCSKLIKRLQRGDYNSKILLEVIRLDRNEYVRPYFDIDISDKDVESFDDVFYEKEKHLKKATDYIETLLGVDYGELAISESDYTDKISYHIVVNRAIKYEDMRALKKENKDDFKKHYFDLSPYGKTQRFRMVLTSKEGKHAPLVPITYADDLTKHFITAVDASTMKIISPYADEEEPAPKPDKKEKKPKKKQQKKEAVPVASNEPDIVTELVKILSPKRTDEYYDWIQVGMCLKSINNKYLSSWIEFSQRSDKFKEGECATKWDSFKPGSYTDRSLHYWAKHDSRRAYEDLLANFGGYLIYNALSGLDRDIAELAQSLFKPDWVFSNKIWYNFDGVRWKMYDSPVEIMVEFSRITRALTKYKTKRIMQIEEAGESKKQADVDEDIAEFTKTMNKVLARCKTTSAQKAILDQMSGLLKVENFESTLDINPKLIGFDDGIYDLQFGKFRKATPDDRVSISCNRTYKDTINVTDEDINDFNTSLTQIFTDDGIRQYMIDLYSTCLNGKSPQMFQINAGHNNTGGNGKGLLKQWTLQALGDYACEFNVGLLTQSASKITAANPEMAKLDRVRFAICCEPEQNAKLNGAIIKKMTGGDSLQCRKLYKNDDSFKAQFSLFMECNKKPAVDAEDGGIERRFRVCEFNSTFTDDDSKVNNTNVFPMDTTMYNAKKMNRFARVWLVMLLENHKKFVTPDGDFIEVPSPDIIKKVTNRYFNETNPFINFLEENIEPCNENNAITLQTLYKNYTMSEEYKNQSKRSRMSKKDCIDSLLKSPYAEFYHHSGSKTTTKCHPITRNTNTLGFHRFFIDEEAEDIF